jgi:hypothetical protein
VGILVAFFFPISEFCIHGPVFESVLKVLQCVKVLVLLHFVVAQRSKRKLIEAAGERGWRNRVVKEDGEGRASGFQGPYPKRWHIRSFLKKKSDSILAQKVATMAY